MEYIPVYTGIYSYQYIPVCLGRLADWSNPPPGSTGGPVGLVVTSQSVQLASVAQHLQVAKLMIPMYLLCLRVQIGVENECYWTEHNWILEHLVFGREAHNM